MTETVFIEDMNDLLSRKRSGLKMLAAAAAAVFCLICCRLSCYGDPGYASVSIITWNVQNLFDGEYDGGEYHEYDPRVSPWDHAAYHSRLERLCSIISASGADIILLQEIEGDDILDDMCSWCLNRTGLRYHAATRDAYSAIQVGVISRYPILELSVHMAMPEPGECSRSILKAVIPVGEERLVILVNHWKSRIGGVEESEASRVASSRLARRLIEREQRLHPRSLVLLAGDLNTSIQDAPEGLSPAMTALQPADSQSSAGSLAVTGDRECVKGSILYDFWMDDTLHIVPAGSYWYRGSWLQLDHLMGDRHLFDGTGLELESVEPYTPASVLDDEGHPYSWSYYTRKGVSDHLPLVMRLVSAE